MATAIIIGAGLAGVTTALYLQRAGVDVHVIEADASAGNGASFANGGLLTPSMSDPWNAPGVWKDVLRYLGDENAPMLLRLHALPGLIAWGARFLAASRRRIYERTLQRNVRLAIYSLHCLGQIREEFDLDFDSVRDGVLKIYRDGESLARGIGKVHAMEPYGIEFKALNSDQVSEYEPALKPIAGQLAGGIFFPNDQIGDALKFVNGIVEQSRKFGVRFSFNQRVAALILDSHTVRGVALESGQKVFADSVVIATGARAATLVRPAGLRLPVQPVKGYSLTYSTKALAGDRRPRLAVVDDDLHAAVVPLKDSLRVAGTAEFTGFDDEVSVARIDNLRGICRAMYPDYSPLLTESSAIAWVGFRPVSAVGSPIVGASRIDGLYLNTGHGPLGWTMAAGSARALADLIVARQDRFDLSEYAA